MTRCARAAVLVLALVVGASALLASGPRYWEGRPAFAPGQALGYFIWNDQDGWHVRWTTKGRRHLFAGLITCDGTFVGFKAVSRDKADFIKETSSRNLRFDAQAQGGTDGVDFRLSPSATYVSFDLTMDGSPVPVEKVHIGRGMHHPSGIPFRIDRNRK